MKSRTALSSRMNTALRAPHALRGRIALLLAHLCLACGCERPADEAHEVHAAHTPAIEGAAGATDVLGAAPGDPPHPWFTEEAAARGIRTTHHSGHDERFFIPEIVGGGAALIDFDQDGWLDLYVVQSGSITAAPEQRPSNVLYRNVGGGMFADVTESSGTGDRGYGIGATVGDIDNDGFPDLYVTNVGENVLYRNRGNGTFEDVSVISGTNHPGFATAAAFLDANRNGLLDLFVVNYLSWSVRSERQCLDDRREPDYCAPGSYNAPIDDVLFRNLGDGRFEDHSIAGGIANHPSTGLGIACADFDQDGFIDIFVANDGMNDHLWMNQGDFTFREEGLRRGCAVDESGVPKAGMGVVAADFTGNGQTDLLVCNLVRESDSLFRNEGGWFTDITARAGLATISRLRTRFGIGAHDFDHDGVLDLFVANGRVARGGTQHTADPYAEPNLLLIGTETGRFSRPDEPTGIDGAEPMTSRAAVFGDIDNDGAVDIIVINRDGPVHLLRNTVPARGAWIMFRVLDRSGRDALHAELRLHPDVDGNERVLLRHVRSDSSYLASNDPRVHAGLGAAEGVRRVEVRWPTGERETFGPFPARAIHELRQGSGRIVTGDAEP